MRKAPSDERFMRDALGGARRALSHGDVPVGAAVVKDGLVIARGWNARERDGDPTAHAEIVAIRRAAKKLGSWRLSGGARAALPVVRRRGHGGRPGVRALRLAPVDAPMRVLLRALASGRRAVCEVRRAAAG